MSENCKCPSSTSYNMTSVMSSSVRAKNEQFTPWVVIIVMFRFWFYFSIENTQENQRIIFNIVNISKSRNLLMNGLTPVVKSSSRYLQKNYKKVSTEYSKGCQRKCDMCLVWVLCIFFKSWYIFNRLNLLLFGHFSSMVWYDNRIFFIVLKFLLLFR